MYSDPGFLIHDWSAYTEAVALEPMQDTPFRLINPTLRQLEIIRCYKRCYALLEYVAIRSMNNLFFWIPFGRAWRENIIIYGNVDMIPPIDPQLHRCLTL